MKTLILLLTLLLALLDIRAEKVVRIYLSDGTIHDYKASEILTFSFHNKTEECLMNAFCQDNYFYSYHTSNVDTIHYKKFFNKERMMTVVEVGYEWYLDLTKIDSIKFEYHMKAPSIEWQNSLGGSKEDYLVSLKKTDDGGYLIFGETNSYDGDVTGNTQSSNLWITKVSSTGVLQWQKPQNRSIYLDETNIQKTFDNSYIVGGIPFLYGKNGHFISKYNDAGSLLWEIWYGEYGEKNIQIIPTIDNGCTVAGSSQINPAPGNHPYDIWLIKLDKNGVIESQKSFGGSYSEHLVSLIPTSDNGYIFTGYTCSSDGDLKGLKKNGSWDYWVVKLDSAYNIVWQKVLGGSDEDIPTSIRETKDHGFIILGNSYSKDGDVVNHHGNSDIWVIKLDSAGKLIWTNSIGGALTDNAEIVEITMDNGCIIAGYSNSINGDIVGSVGINSYWIVKLDTDGKIQWQKPIIGFGGTDNYDEDYIFKILVDKDGYILLGSTRSNGGDITGHINNTNSYDYWVAKLSLNGEIIWQKSYGGSKSDYANDIFHTDDGGLLLSGRSGSNDGVVINNHGLRDIWILKLGLACESAKTDSLLIEMNNDVTSYFSISQINKIEIQNLTSSEEETFSKDKLSISPNPVTDYIEISFGANGFPPLQGDVRIYDIFGQLKTTPSLRDTPPYQGGERVKIDVSSLVPGMYFVRIGDRVGKFVKL